MVFAYVVENLPLTKQEIFNAAHSYLLNAYKETKYNITEKEPEKGTVCGSGSYVGVYENNSVTSGKIFDADFQLRVSAQDSRARVQIIVRNYKMVTVRDFGSNSREEVLISSMAPIADNKDQHKVFKKAFVNLQERAQKTINLMTEALKSTQPSSDSDDSNW